MAITKALSEKIGLSAGAPTRVARVRITCDSDYPAGGYSMNFAGIASLEELGTSKPAAVLVEAISDPSFKPQYLRATDKLFIFDYNTDAEAAVGLNALDGVTIDLALIYV